MSTAWRVTRFGVITIYFPPLPEADTPFHSLAMSSTLQKETEL